jgi:hypothetical protein
LIRRTFSVLCTWICAVELLFQEKVDLIRAPENLFDAPAIHLIITS